MACDHVRFTLYAAIEKEVNERNHIFSRQKKPAKLSVKSMKV